MYKFEAAEQLGRPRVFTMPNRSLPTLIAAATVSLSASLAASQPSGAGPLLLGLERTITWTAGTANLPIRMGPGLGGTLEVTQDPTRGVRFQARIAGIRSSLPVDFGPETGSGAFDEQGRLRDGYRLQLGTHDFTGDGQPEAIVASGDGEADLVVNVLAYRAATPAKPANWKLIGRFSGETTATVKSNKIQLPYGRSGQRLEYTWVTRKAYFLRTN